jgi:hypothetical protein
MRRELICLMLAGSLALPWLPSCHKGPDPEPLLSFDFDTDLRKREVKKLLALPNLELEEGMGVGGSNGLRVSYVGFERGSERIIRHFRLPGAYPEATLNYSVKFSEDFQFVMSGKLHGLAPDKVITGGAEMVPYGWSARLNFNRDGIKSYIYHQDKNQLWGDSRYSETFRFVPGKYHELALYVKVNDPPEAHNGTVEIYADGQCLVVHDSLQLRSVGGDSTLITQFLFETFHGGSSPDFAPRDSLGNYTTVIAWFDNIEIYKGKYIRSQQ